MNTLFEQLGKIWKELSAAQKMTIVAAALAVAVGMGALVFYSSRPQMRLLYGGIDSKDMAEVISTLDEEKIPYEMGAGGRSVFVPSEKVYQLRMKMAGEGIPSGGGVGYEIFDKGNFGVSDFVQRANYVRALQGELSRSINQLEGVRASRVMIVLPENKLLVTNDHARPTASVFVDVGGRSLSEENVTAIRYLVANSVEGLKTTDVAVVDNTGKVLSSNSEEESTFGAAAGHLKFRKSIEDYFTKKIETMLAPIVGEGNVVVRVSADLSFDAQTLVEEKYDPEGQVIRSQTSQEETSSSSENSPGGVVGTAANGPGASGAAAALQNSNSNSQKNKSISYEINKSVSETVRTPGSIKSISAAIFLAKKVEGGSTTSAPVNRTAQELDTIKKMVINALGLDPASTPDQRVTVDEMTFEKPAALAVEKTNTIASATGGASGLMEMGRKLLAIAAAVGIFLFFLKMLKNQKNEPASLEVVEEKQAASAQQPVAVTPELLNNLIQQKPENVSATLKTWVAAGQNRR